MIWMLGSASSTTRSRRTPRQAELVFRTWGGRRRGAGRKPNGEKAGVSHLHRAALAAHTPVHVTLRVRAGLPSLRRRGVFRRVHRALVEGRERFGFRLCQYSVQGNHIHVIAEASDRRALSRGMQGLAIRIARTVNRGLALRGRVFADRYHARALKTPLEVRHALRYVLQNAAHHGNRRVGLDSCSSAPSFGGWLGRSGGAATALVSDDAIVSPRSWLLRVGWRKRGWLHARDTPRG
jgi:REP element-mobilizing transposase RayT